LLRGVALASLFALYGAVSIVWRLVTLARRTAVVIRLLRRRLRCPACGGESETAGRWVCAACSSEYLGAVVACPYCGAHASHYPCERCGVSIPLEPWREE